MSDLLLHCATNAFHIYLCRLTGLWYCIMLTACKCLSSIMGVPHLALGNELTPAPSERVKVWITFLFVVLLGGAGCAAF